MTIRPFHKILCANRGEIAIRVFRAAAELGMRTVAVFSEEDATNQHRYKADESYLIGRGKTPVAAYLDGDEILAVARKAKVDAIHPGYGFLSENHRFAAAVRAAGIAFLGPKAEVISGLGDKVLARHEAQRLQIPTVPGSELPLDEAMAIHVAQGNRKFEGYAWWHRAELALRRSLIDDACRCADAATLALNEASDAINLARLRCLRGRIACAGRDPAAAREHLQAAETAARELGAGDTSPLGQDLAALRQALAASGAPDA